MNAAQVKDALRTRHGMNTGSGEWVCIEEAFCGWASAGGGIDLLAIGAWRSARASGLNGITRVGYPTVAYEVKVSRADFKRELYGYTPGPKARWNARAVPPWPGKAYWALERCNYFMFAVPKGLLMDHELQRREPPETGTPLWVPEGVGLVEVVPDGRCSVRVQADPRPGRELKRAEVAELVRHAVDPNYVRKLRAELAMLRANVEYLSRAREAV